jgi:hypothetical protein
MNNEDKYENMNKQEKAIYNFLHDCNIVFEDFNHLDGMLFSSSSLTSLQKDAKTKQKWPLLNLVRQILRTNDYAMEPKRKSNGYDDDGKKKYLRFFIIHKKKVEENINLNL